MPECAFHKGVETRVTCIDCGRYICPKDMIETAVGYKCPECGRARKPTLGGVKPQQLVTGAAVGFGVAVVGGVVLTFVPFLHLWAALLYGVAVGEATRRGSGGHRTWEFATIAAAAALLGTFAGLVFGRWDLLAAILAPIAAAVMVKSISW